MNTNIDLINTVYIALALFIGIASVVLFAYAKDRLAKAIEKVYANNPANTVHTVIADLKKEARISIWLAFCTNIGICFLIFKGLH
jgi:hypothetical protein